ncbi:hypothetical protein Dimus_007560 [Dionaea muscipula]
MEENRETWKSRWIFVVSFMIALAIPKSISFNQPLTDEKEISWLQIRVHNSFFVNCVHCLKDLLPRYSTQIKRTVSFPLILQAKGTQHDSPSDAYRIDVAD